MKLKEMPIALYYAVKLHFTSAKMLKAHTGDEAKVVVSFTSIPSRFKQVHLTVKSILIQNPKPERIVLWVNESHKNLIPESLRNLEGDIFQIQYSHLFCSHKKLIHSLKIFKDLPIVTIDDDCIYRQNWLKQLLYTHQQYPNVIIANRIRCIKKDQKNNYLPYKQWTCDGDKNPKAMMGVGAEGILYPPHIFSDLIFDEVLFLELAPKADDLWFKVAALMQGINYKKTLNPPKDSIPLFRTQKTSLKKDNIDLDRNRAQWKNLEDHFHFSI